MRILIAIDDSECSSIVVDSILNNCWSGDVTFNVITVVEPLNIQFALSGAYYLDAVAEAQRDFADRCRQFLEEKVELLKNKLGANRITSKVIDGDIASSIVAEAMEWDADLIILGSHGRSGFQKLLLGSVAEKVVSHAPCSVQIVKPKVKKEKSAGKKLSTSEAIS